MNLDDNDVGFGRVVRAFITQPNQPLQNLQREVAAKVEQQKDKQEAVISGITEVHKNTSNKIRLVRLED